MANLAQPDYVVLAKQNPDGSYAPVDDPAEVEVIEVSEPSISGAAAITPSDTVTVTARRQFLINCIVAGNVKVAFSDTSTLTVPIAVGISILPWAVIQVFVTGTTATATYANLI